MKKFFLAVAATLLLVGCAHREAEYAGGYGAGAYYLGDCYYSDICGPYGRYFYYTPYYPLGPVSPARLQVDRAAANRVPRVVMPRGVEGSFGSTHSISTTGGSSAPPESVPSAPISPPPAPPPVHTVAPRG